MRYSWIVDPAVRMIEIFELGDDGRYTRALGAGEGTARDVPGCPGLVLELDELWAAVDRLQAD